AGTGTAHAGAGGRRRRRGRPRLAGARAVRPDRPGGVLPREGRLHPRGQEGLPLLRRPRRVPRVRAAERRALRDLGRAQRAGAAQAQEARGL
ncbi:MAG: Transcription_WhiB, partial [uncultured Friedmanniella sp.]